jgi:hypothetical protein
MQSSSLFLSLFQVFQVISPIETAKAAASLSDSLQKILEKDLTVSFNR